MTKSFWQNIKKPIVGLAPMDGYSDSAFRRICKWVQPNIITVTEFTSADGLFYNAQRVKDKLKFDPSEQPVIAQIFGKNTETFVAAAKICEDMGFSGIDINMGCPSKNVVRSEHGIALRKNHPLAFELIEALANATKLPISVKTRLGWCDASDLSPFCIGAQNAGANMICIHARTYTNPYKVPAQWEHVFELKKQLAIPILGNGGILNVKDGLEKCKPLDGFLIGQASIGDPWVFLENQPPLTLKEKLPVILQHGEWMIESKGERIGIREFRKHLLSYIKNTTHAKELRSQCARIETLADLIEALKLIETMG